MEHRHVLLAHFPRDKGTGASSPGRSLKFGSLKIHFLHSGARISVFEHNTNIKFWLFFIQREYMLLNTLNV